MAMDNSPFIVDFPIYTSIYSWLVVQQPSWKMMEFVNGKDDIPYMKWKIIQMFQTTNQKTTTAKLDAIYLSKCRLINLSTLRNNLIMLIF